MAARQAALPRAVGQCCGCVAAWRGGGARGMCRLATRHMLVSGPEQLSQASGLLTVLVGTCGPSCVGWGHAFMHAWGRTQGQGRV